jgi:hypothetical protein
MKNKKRNMILDAIITNLSIYETMMINESVELVNSFNFNEQEFNEFIENNRDSYGAFIEVAKSIEFRDIIIEAQNDIINPAAIRLNNMTPIEFAKSVSPSVMKDIEDTFFVVYEGDVLIEVYKVFLVIMEEAIEAALAEMISEANFARGYETEASVENIYGNLEFLPTGFDDEYIQKVMNHAGYDTFDDFYDLNDFVYNMRDYHNYYDTKFSFNSSRPREEHGSGLPSVNDRLRHCFNHKNTLITALEPVKGIFVNDTWSEAIEDIVN